MRRVLDALSKRLDGKKAAASTVYRKRAGVHNFLESGVELGYFESNPLKKIKKKGLKATEAIDPAYLPDHKRAQALLTAVEHEGKAGRHVVAYFACILLRGHASGRGGGPAPCQLHPSGETGPVGRVSP